ncbi:UDP-N-acetylmuramate dehydrogenase [Novosphingobium sp. P6W]|uniref:UDP-N-acetylmuramate dehydrogenase n=1 Tax=Novosphingobium sp. P6W TaxID=1609758 RepID=UPI0009E38274|nr:FAD-binding protein [Novosphingobium sp. P6W]AXB80657.1 FAD-binding protein [Novosphingobium sp. P6W]
MTSPAELNNLVKSLDDDGGSSPSAMAERMMHSIAEVVRRLRSLEISVNTDVRLASETYLRTGGIAKVIAYPKNTIDIINIFRLLSEFSLPYKVIGNTSNLLFKDDNYYTFLISVMRMTTINYDAETQVFTAQSGVMMPELSRQALYNGVSGFEGLEGIPGTVGGGLFMNAGAYGYELKDVLTGAEIVHPDGKVETLSTAQFELDHRTSILRKGRAGSIVTTLYFKGKAGNSGKIFSKMEVFHSKRHKYQDFMYPNLGSIFSGSPYRVLARRDRYYRIMSALYFLFRYKTKIFHRESPINRRWLNALAVSRFPALDYAVQPYSDKTLNCLVNRGQGTEAMIKFIKDLEALSQGEIPIENEIVEPF